MDIDFYLSCHGDDGKNCGFDGNDICEFLDSDHFSSEVVLHCVPVKHF